MPLLCYQRKLLSSNHADIKQALERVFVAQTRIITTWYRERLQVITSISRARHLASIYRHRLPRFLQEDLRSGCIRHNTGLQEGNFHVYQGVIKKLDGSHIKINLYVRGKFDHTSSRKYGSGNNTLVNETIYLYNIIYEWRLAFLGQLEVLVGVIIERKII